MAYELKAGKGSIFKNKNKTSDKHPEYTGKIKTPDGKEWDISLWVKEGSKGKFFSVNTREPYQKEQQPKTSPIPQAFNNAVDDLPF